MLLVAAALASSLAAAQFSCWTWWSAAPAHQLAPTSGDLVHGAYISGAPHDPARIDEFNSMVGTPTKIVMWYVPWENAGYREFSVAHMDAVASRGAMPLVTWEPYDWDDRATEQPKYALSTIVAGDHDTYIRQWAQNAATWGKPFYLRWAHEMNGNWYPWSSGVNGNTDAEYVSAWKHIHTIFEQEGATNVRWVWSPNVRRGDESFADLYPGDSYVDWVGIDGYNWGKSRPSSKGQTANGWQMFAVIFRPTYQELAALTDKPMMIAETASAEAGGDKATWIRKGLLKQVPSRLPRVRAVIWFNENKEADWRVNSSAASLAAYAEAAASPLYGGQLP